MSGLGSCVREWVVWVWHWLGRLAVGLGFWGVRWDGLWGGGGEGVGCRSGEAPGRGRFWVLVGLQGWA